MGLVGIAAILLAASGGCYDPSLRDCTVTCAASTDCAHGQFCAAGGWCAGEGVTCTSMMQPVDAPPTAVDAPAATPDAAAATATLRVYVKNKGQVTVPGLGTCTNPNNGAQDMLCTYMVVEGVKLTVTASQISGGKAFDRWGDPVCKDQDASCMFTTLQLTLIEAQFQ